MKAKHGAVCTESKVYPDAFAVSKCYVAKDDVCYVAKRKGTVIERALVEFCPCEIRVIKLTVRKRAVSKLMRANISVARIEMFECLVREIKARERRHGCRKAISDTVSHENNKQKPPKWLGGF